MGWMPIDGNNDLFAEKLSGVDNHICRRIEYLSGSIKYHEKENDLEPCIGTCVDGNSHRHSNLRLCRHMASVLTAFEKL